MSNAAGGGKAKPPSTRTEPATCSGARALARAVTKAPIEWPTRTGPGPDGVGDGQHVVGVRCRGRTGPAIVRLSARPRRSGARTRTLPGPRRRFSSSATQTQLSPLAVIPWTAMTTGASGPGSPALRSVTARLPPGRSIRNSGVDDSLSVGVTLFPPDVRPGRRAAGRRSRRPSARLLEHLTARRVVEEPLGYAVQVHRHSTPRLPQRGGHLRPDATADEVVLERRPRRRPCGPGRRGRR